MWKWLKRQFWTELALLAERRGNMNQAAYYLDKIED